MGKSISYIRNSLENLNFATFVLAGLGAFAALWLNSKYVSNEVYERDQKILILKITNLETETQAIRYMAMTNTEDIKKILPIVNKIEELISSLITPSGDVIISENMKQLEIDIAEIKKDIEYMKNRLWPMAD